MLISDASVLYHKTRGPVRGADRPQRVSKKFVYRSTTDPKLSKYLLLLESEYQNPVSRELSIPQETLWLSGSRISRDTEGYLPLRYYNSQADVRAASTPLTGRYRTSE